MTAAFEMYLTRKASGWSAADVSGLSLEFLVAFGRELTPRLDVHHRVRSTLWDTLKAQWAFWIPAQLINFKYVPVRHQLNFVLVVSLAWTTFLSLAFPPPRVEDKERA